MNPNRVRLLLLFHDETRLQATTLRLQLALALHYDFQATTHEIHLAKLETAALAYLCGPCFCAYSELGFTYLDFVHFEIGNQFFNNGAFTFINRISVL